jgi:hypothetical protein
VTTRILPPDEWDRLSETDIPAYLPMAKPEDVQVVVVEDDGRIVGAWAVLRVVHLEGVWIAPEYRKRSSVARRLLVATFEAAKAWAPGWAFTGADSDDVRRLITKHLGGRKAPFDLYVVPVR